LAQPEAFAALFRGSYSLILHIAYRRLGDYHLAQDAAQLTFIAAFRNLSSLRDAGACRSWLCRIAVSQCARLRRQPYGTAEQAEATETVVGSVWPEEDRARRELACLAVRLLDELPSGYAEVLRRYYLRRETTPVIAAALDLPRTTVKKRLFDGRRLLRRLLSIELGSSHVGRAAEVVPDL
jgi:RNA polymerase sigma-70 factor (ECF subfamily)